MTSCFAWTRSSAAWMCSVARLVTYAVPTIWLSARPDFRIEQVWYLSIATTTLQAALSLWLLHREFRRRLVPSSAGIAGEAARASV